MREVIVRAPIEHAMLVMVIRRGRGRSSRRSKRPGLEPTQPTGGLVGVLAHALATTIVALLEHVAVRWV